MVSYRLFWATRIFRNCVQQPAEFSTIQLTERSLDVFSTAGTAQNPREKTLYSPVHCLNAVLCYEVTVRLESIGVTLDLIQVLRARTTIGRRSFAVAGPSLWNSLPAALRRPEMTLHTFKRQLKLSLIHI